MTLTLSLIRVQEINYINPTRTFKSNWKLRKFYLAKRKKFDAERFKS